MGAVLIQQLRPIHRLAAVVQVLLASTVLPCLSCPPPAHPTTTPSRAHMSILIHRAASHDMGLDELHDHLLHQGQHQSKGRQAPHCSHHGKRLLRHRGTGIRELLPKDPLGHLLHKDTGQIDDRRKDVRQSISRTCVHKQ